MESHAMYQATKQACANNVIYAKAFLQLGVLYWRRGNFDRSEQLLTKASEICIDQNNIQFLSQCFIALALVKTSLEKDDDAILAYKHALKLSPENCHLWNNLASLYLKNEQHANALFAYERAIKINPGDAVAWNGLASIYDRNGKTEEAIFAYKRAITLVPDINFEESNQINRTPEIKKLYISPLSRLAALYTKKEQYQKAIETYSQALKLDAENAKLWNEIGVLYLDLDANEDACRAFSKAIELDPEHGEAFMNLGHAYARLDMPRESIPLFIKSIEILPNRQDRERACNLLEKVLSDLNQSAPRHANQKEKKSSLDASDETVTWSCYQYNKEYTSFASPYPIDEKANSFVYASRKLLIQNGNQSNFLGKEHKSKIGVFKMLGQLSSSPIKEAQPKRDFGTAYTQTSRDEIADPVVWNEKGNIHFNNQDYQGAIISYNNAIKIDPSFGQPYHNLALIHFIQGNYDEAILLYRKSIQYLNKNREKAIAWNGLGNLYRYIKDYENARTAYQQASEIDKSIAFDRGSRIVFEIHQDQRTASYWMDLGKMLFKTGAYGKATSAFRKVVELKPTDGQAYSFLARALTAQGQYKEAISLYRKSIELLSDKKEKASAWNRLGDVYRKLNDHENALKAYKNAFKITNGKFSLVNRARLSLLSNCAAK